MAAARALGTVRRIGVVGAMAFAVAGAAAQEDVRDVVTLRDGRELRGRVFSRYEPELVLQNATRRQRIPVANVRSVDTVRDRVAEFLSLRDRLDHARHRWFLVGWAEHHGLHDLAALQALELVLEDPEHAEAHVFLGHRRHQTTWLWPFGDEWRTLAQLERHYSDAGHPWELASEHYRVRSNAELRRVVATLFDLERLHRFWFDTFGESLHLYEVVGAKLLVRVARGPSSFSALSSSKHPYFRHRIEDQNDEASSFTYFAEPPGERAARLFEVVTQHLLYRTLADDPALRTAHRYCGWAEIGLGQYVARRLDGPAGHAEPRPWSIDAGEGRLVANGRSQGLENMLHRSVRQYYFVVSDEEPWDWSAAHLSVAYLLDDARQPPVKGAFLRFLTEALRGAKGDSSSELDKQLGGKIEALEAPWRRWIDEELANK